MEIREIENIINDVINKTDEYDPRLFLTMVAAMLETYCDKNDLDVVGIACMLCETIIEVNAALNGNIEIEIDMKGVTS